MHYWLNVASGTVVTLEDHEEAEKTLTPGEYWLPVHLHPNVAPPKEAVHQGTIPFEPPAEEKPKRRVRTPGPLGKTFAVIVSASLAVALLSGALGLAVLGIRFAIGAFA